MPKTKPRRESVKKIIMQSQDHKDFRIKELEKDLSDVTQALALTLFQIGGEIEIEDITSVKFIPQQYEFVTKDNSKTGGKIIKVRKLKE